MGWRHALTHTRIQHTAVWVFWSPPGVALPGLTSRELSMVPETAGYYGLPNLYSPPTERVSHMAHKKIDVF